MKNKKIVYIALLVIAIITGTSIICLLGRNVENEYIGDAEKYINAKGKEFNDEFEVGDYNVCINRLVYDKGVRRGYCEMTVSKKDGSEKFDYDKIYDIDVSRFGNVEFCIDEIPEFISIEDGDQKIIDGKCHKYFGFSKEEYIYDMDENSAISFSIYDLVSSKYEYELVDTDGFIMYVECDNGTKIYVTDYCLRLQGENYLMVMPENLHLIYENGSKEIIYDDTKFKGLNHHKNKTEVEEGKELAYSLVDYTSEYELSKLKSILYNGKIYDIQREEV